MCVRIIIDDNQYKVFKTYSEARDYLKMIEEANKVIRSKGAVVMTKKEYGKYLNK